MKRKRGFTIIELIVVIAVLGILVLLATFKFIGYNEKAIQSAVKADRKTVQTAVDMKITDNEGISPYNLEVGDAKKLDVTTLKPEYLAHLKPIEGYEFWIDSWDNVYYTKLMPPQNVKHEEGMLSWNAVEKADNYKIYKIADKKEVSLLDLIGIKTVMADSFQSNLEKKLYTTTNELSIELPEGTYLVSAINKKDESVSVGENFEIEKDVIEEENKSIDGVPKDDEKFSIKINDDVIVKDDGSVAFQSGDWIYSGANPTFVTADKEFHTGGTKGSGLYIYNLPKDMKIATFELTVKNLLNGGAMNSSMFIRTMDSGIGFYFFPNRVEIYDLTSSPIKTIYLDVTQYHVYRIVKNDKTATVYIDGEKIQTFTLRSGSGYSQQRFFFGDGTTASRADNSTYFKDIKIAPGEEIHPN